MTATAPELLSVSSDTRSAALFEDARRLMPGGVSSPVRAFRSVGGVPRFMERGEGAYLIDADGTRYVDYVLSWGALALGHAHPAVVDAVVEQAAKGMTFGAPTELESALAACVISAVPSVEMVRFVSTGTEAVMSAVRLARAATQRAKIIKLAGCYHGHADAFLVDAGSGVATLGIPGSPGVSPAVASETLVAPYNDAEAVAALLEAHAGEVAAVIVEPIAANMGLVLPRPDYLHDLRRITREHGTLLIFDEVITGFRVAWGGAQAHFDVTPDLTCLGKIVGGGLPAAAFGGRRDLMELMAPSGPVYQAGTLSGNPLAMAAGLATLRELARPGVYASLAAAATTLAELLSSAARDAGVHVQTTTVGGLWGFFCTDRPVVDYATARSADTRLYARLFHAMLAEGIYLAPSQFETAFVSTAHTDRVLGETSEAFGRAFGRLR